MEDVDEHGRDEDVGVDVHGGMDGYRYIKGGKTTT